MKSTIIGAGGITSYFLPVFLRMYSQCSVEIWDGDELEPRNLQRQSFSPAQTGKNKAEALKETVSEFLPDSKINVVKSYFRPNDVFALRDSDVIFCFADNRTAKKEVLRACDRLELPCVIAGNEYVDNEAWLYLPRMKDHPEMDPRKRFPELLSDEPDTDDPASCSAPETLAVHPQLSMANMGAAYKALRLHYFLYENSLEKIMEALPESDPFEFVPFSFHDTLLETGTNKL